MYKMRKGRKRQAMENHMEFDIGHNEGATSNVNDAVEWLS